MLRFLAPHTSRPAIHSAITGGGTRSGRRWARHLHAALVSFLILSFPSTSWAEKAKRSTEEIFQEVSRSVAVIDDLESHGSGVVLTEDGQVLTNYHVVASGLPLSVTVMVKKGEDAVSKTFKDIKVSKVHPLYDLALLQLDLDGEKCFAAKRVGKSEEIKTGSTCYAIGNPGGAGGNALVNSITEGLVSSASREVDGLKYIQVSTALNPGNSGGALCDDQGNVIGIATWKLDQADNIGFAIPMSGFQLSEFGPVAKRKPDLETGKRYEEEANRIVEIAEQLVGEDRNTGIRVAAFLYRKSIEATPNHPAPYNNVGIMYFRLQEDEIARAYLERALEIQPIYATSMSTLGIILARNGWDEKLAEELWFKGVTDRHNPGGASDCAENLAISFIREENPVAAGYCVAWANSLKNPPPHRQATRVKILENSYQVLNGKQFSHLQAEDTEFSAEGLEVFQKMQAGNAENPGLEAFLGKPADQAKLIEAAKKMALTAVPVPENGIMKPLPAKPAKVIMGYAGTCLLIELPELRKIAVFDLFQAKITKYIDLPAREVVFAAGGRVLLILNPDNRVLNVWDMETWEKKGDILLRTTREIVSLGMGLLRDDFAVVIHPDGNSNDCDKIAFLTLKDGKLIVPEVVQSSVGMNLHHLYAHMGERSTVSVDEAGLKAVVLGSGRGFVDLSDFGKTEISYFHSGGWQAAQFTLGGSHVVFGGSSIYKTEGEEELLRPYDKLNDRNVNRLGVLNVFGHKGFVEFGYERNEEPKMTVRALPQLNEVVSKPIDMESYRKIDRSCFNGRAFASAYAKRCALVDEDEKSVLLLPLDIENPEVIAEFGPDSRFVRKINFEEDTVVTLDSGPPGMSYDRESKSITWKVPKDQETGSEVSVIFLLKDSKGQESYHVEKIVIP